MNMRTNVVALGSKVQSFREFVKRKFPSPEWSKGWRLTALLGFLTTLVVLIVNTTVLIWYEVAAPFNGGVKVLFSGDCKKAESISTWSHLAINAFSTLLLASSNFCTFKSS